ncbi:hypothetical protein G4D82_00730 [Flavobacterium sp. CYK-4]|uniref:hypothetical protein n=1 Tax=Flavobacterium lotistagni TaxID=2709660 RepID=UPI001407A71E|nr:hypothetical protein [Flavobacterium lotistagni]NHM05732.1 hypothetical protein [Flavobacterium lotistagni]
MFFWEGRNLNQKTFVFGALIYIALFIYESFKNLSKENLAFFSNNDYTILFAPVYFFMGMSFTLGFGDFKLLDYLIYNDITLYSLINCFVNIVYYGLIDFYIYKEQKLKNA